MGYDGSMGTNAMRGDAMRCEAMRCEATGGCARVIAAGCAGSVGSSQSVAHWHFVRRGNECQDGREGLQRGRRKGKEDGERLGGGPGGGRKPRNALTSPFCRKSWHRLLPRGRVLMIHIPTGVPEKRHQDGTASSFRPLVFRISAS